MSHKNPIHDLQVKTIESSCNLNSKPTCYSGSPPPIPFPPKKKMVKTRVIRKQNPKKAPQIWHPFGGCFFFAVCLSRSLVLDEDHVKSSMVGNVYMENAIQIWRVFFNRKNHLIIPAGSPAAGVHAHLRVPHPQGRPPWPIAKQQRRMVDV